MPNECRTYIYKSNGALIHFHVVYHPFYCEYLCPFKFTHFHHSIFGCSGISRAVCLIAFGQYEFFEWPLPCFKSIFIELMMCALKKSFFERSKELTEWRRGEGGGKQEPVVCNRVKGISSVQFTTEFRAHAAIFESWFPNWPITKYAIFITNSDQNVFCYSRHKRRAIFKHLTRVHHMPWIQRSMIVQRKSEWKWQRSLEAKRNGQVLMANDNNQMDIISVFPIWCISVPVLRKTYGFHGWYVIFLISTTCSELLEQKVFSHRGWRSVFIRLLFTWHLLFIFLDRKRWIEINNLQGSQVDRTISNAFGTNRICYSAQPKLMLTRKIANHPTTFRI